MISFDMMHRKKIIYIYTCVSQTFIFSPFEVQAMDKNYKVKLLLKIVMNLKKI